MARKDKPGRVKSALLNWLGVPLSLTSGEFWAEWHGQSSSGRSVTVDNSMQLSAVWACVRLVSETISTLPLRLYQRNGDGSRTIASSHPLYQVLSKSPNREMTPSRFMLMILASICLWGNAFVEKRMIGSRIVALEPLRPQRVSVKRLDNGALEYRYVDPLTGKERILAEDRMMHIRGFGIDGVCGCLPIMTGKNVLGAAAASEEAAAKVFSQGMQASGILSADGTLKEEQRERLRKNLTVFMGSKNAGKVMVAEAGMKYQSITMNPEAAQMLETRSFSIEEICRWFRVPPFMVGHMDKQSSWASSVEGMNMQFLTNSLRPVLVNIEQEIARCLLGNSDQYYVEFAVEGLLRADSKGRAEYYNLMLQNGVMSRNEVRKLENLPQVDGGDILTVQSNMTRLDQVGQQSDSETARAAFRNWLNAGNTDNATE